MYSITVRNNILIAHSLPGEVFGPAQNMHGATYIVDAEFYAKEVNNQLKKIGLNSEVDLKNHNLNYKIREHSLTKVPMLLICGKKEVDSNSVTIRRLDSNKQENMELNLFLKKFSALNKASSN